LPEQMEEMKPQSGTQGGGGSSLKAAVAAAAAAATAAMVARKVMSGGGGGSNGERSRNGGGTDRGHPEGMLGSIASGGWDAARDALVPAAEDAAAAIGSFVAENAPEVVRERIVPRFIASFNEARGDSSTT
jgi:hypothetical protein